MTFLAQNIGFLLHKNRLNANQLQIASEEKGFKIPQTTTTRILNGDTKSPGAQTVQKYADFFGVNASDIVYRDLRKIALAESMKDGTPMNEVSFRGVEFWEGDVPLDDDEFEAPYYKDVEFKGGHGAAPQWDDGRRKIKYGITAANRAGAHPDHTICLTLRGDSMEDKISDGAMIAVDTSKKQPKEGKIFAFCHGGMLRVKYLIPRPHGALLIRSHNPSYSDEELTAEEVQNDVEIIGWVWNWSSVDKW